jgi:hypothetical protein
MGGVIMSSVIISGDSSGAITLAAPSVAGTNTITLPASTGTVLTTGSPQSGGVIQVVSASSTGVVSNTTQTYADTNLSVTITPKFSTSKILVLVSQPYQVSKSSSTAFGSIKLLRNSTTIVTPVADATGAYELGIYANGATTVQTYTRWAVQYLDSPATTSATIYKTQCAVYDATSSNTIRVNQSDANGASYGYITVMEIAA